MISEELQEQSKPWFVIVSVMAFAVVLFFSIYYEIQDNRIQSAISDMKAKKEELTNAKGATSLANDRARALTAKEYIAELDKKQVVWSRVVEKIESVIPKNTESLQPIVVFRSYSGSNEGRLAINAITQPAAVDPFADISSTIKAFSSDPTFKNVFVPSISKSLTSEGVTILSFSMNLEYDPQNLLVRPRAQDSLSMPTEATISTSTTSTTEVTPTQKPTTPRSSL